MLSYELVIKDSWELSPELKPILTKLASARVFVFKEYVPYEFMDPCWSKGMTTSNSEIPDFLGNPFPAIWVEWIAKDPPRAEKHEYKKIGFLFEEKVPVMRMEGGTRTQVHDMLYLFSTHRVTEELKIQPFVLASEKSLDSLVPHEYARFTSENRWKQMFYFFQMMAKECQFGTEKTNIQFRVGSGANREKHRIKEIVHVRLKKKVYPKDEEMEKRNIVWSHRWEVMGHWRKIEGVGKDNLDKYCVKGLTWVKPHTKGPEEKDVVKKVRLVT